MTKHQDLAETWLSRDDAAAYIRNHHGRRCQSAYLAKLAWARNGPRFYRRDGAIVYRQSDLDAWAVGRLEAVSGPFPKRRPQMSANAV